MPKMMKGITDRAVIGASTLGGLNRTKGAAKYLFSGSMICGYPKSDGSICGGPITTIDGGRRIFVTVAGTTDTKAPARTR
jgi:hypothetical protein